MSASEPRVETRRYTGKDYLILIALAALVAIAFWDVVARGRVFFFRDFGFFFYPKRVVVAEAIRALRIPFWNSIEACGTPVLGAYQAAVFYPPAVIYYLLPLPSSLMWFVVLHFFISGAGAYYMLRLWGARRPAAAFGAVAWAFSPVFISSLDYVSFHTSLAWLPWCMAFVRRIVLQPSFRAFALFSLAFAMAVLAAAPEPVIFIGILTTGYGLWRLVASLAKKRPLGSSIAPFAVISAAIVTGVLISGVEIVPFLHALRYSARQKPLLLEDAAIWSAAPRDAALVFLPRFQLAADRGGIHWGSQHWLKSVYLGAMVPALVAWTVFAVRRKRNWFFAVAAVPFLLLAVGPNSPVWPFAYKHIPGLGLIRFPVKFYIPAAFSAAVIAAFAIDDLLVFFRARRRTLPAVLLLLLLAGAAVFAAGWVAMDWYPAKIFAFLTPPESLGAGPESTRLALERFLSTQWSLARISLHLALGAAAIGLAGFFAARRLHRPYGTIAVVMMLFIDVGVFSAHLNPTAGPEVYTARPAHFSAVPSGPSDTRVYATPDLTKSIGKKRLARIMDITGLRNYLSLVRGEPLDDQDILTLLDRTSAPRFRSIAEADLWLRETYSTQFTEDVQFELVRETFCPDVNLIFRVPMAEGFEPLTVRQHFDLLEAGVLRRVSESRIADLARMWGTAVVIQLLPEPPGFVYLDAPKPGRRAILADQVLPVASEAEAEAILVETAIDPTSKIILLRDDAKAAREFLGDSPAPLDGQPSDLGVARVIRDNGNRSAFEVEAGKKCLLFVADCFFPNFAATVDGKPVPIWRANYAYRAVPVEQGKHVVEFVWRPYDFYIGLAVTVLTLAALGLVGYVRRRP